MFQGTLERNAEEITDPNNYLNGCNWVAFSGYVGG
jgi:hypothetical protein